LRASAQLPEPQGNYRPLHDPTQPQNVQASSLLQVSISGLDCASLPTKHLTEASTNNGEAAHLSKSRDLISKIWNEAYDELKNADETKGLMDSYERILSSKKVQIIVIEKKKRIEETSRCRHR
jgi:hypothetical protein